MNRMLNLYRERSDKIPPYIKLVDAVVVQALEDILDGDAEERGFAEGFLHKGWEYEDFLSAATYAALDRFRRCGLESRRMARMKYQREWHRERRAADGARTKTWE